MKLPIEAMKYPWITIALGFIAAMTLLCGCAGTKADPGTAEAMAVTDQARAATIKDEALNAHLKAADDTAKAAALQEIALRTKTKDDIDKAVAAQVEATEANAVAVALDAAGAKADTDAKEATEQADTERIQQQKADEVLWWTRITQIVGALGIGAGILLGGVVGYVTQSARSGIALGGLIAAAGFGVATYGALAPWMILVLGFLILGGLIAWFAVHVGDKHALTTIKTAHADISAELAKLKATSTTDLDKLRAAL